MPCYRCGVRQTDPSRGQSPWKRGVVRHSQILICPGCQDAADWTAELDRCSRCSSVRLVKRLGEVECRDCGAIVAPEGAGEAGFADEAAGAALDSDSGGASGAAGTGLESVTGLEAGTGLQGAGRGADLSEEVARALDRVLGRSLVSQSIQRAPDPEGTAGSAGSRAGAGRHRPARPESGHHAAAHPGAERHRASRPGAAGADAASLDVIRPGGLRGEPAG